MTIRVALGADRNGFAFKSELVPWLQAQGYPVSDLGAYGLDPADDYPDFAAAVAREVASGEAERGILICGSGVGACIAANKVVGVRGPLPRHLLRSSGSRGRRYERAVPGGARRGD